MRVLTIAAFASVFVFGVNPSNAETLCMTKELYKTVMSGKWVPFDTKVGNRRYKGKARWLPGGIAEVTTSSAIVHRGTWRKETPTKVCAYYPTRIPSTLCFRIKNKCAAH